MEVRIRTPEAFKELYSPHRYKVFYGGRGGAKSWAFADALLLLGVQRPIRILCAREIQKSIKDSVHALLSIRIRDNQLPYQVFNDEIRGQNGTVFLFAGLWHNIENIKSKESIDICWVEEANRVSDDSWGKLIPTIRKSGSEIWVSFNPGLPTDAVWQRFIEHTPPDAYVKKVSWRDNEWFTDEMRADMEHLKSTDYDEYLHVWEGEFKNYADGAVYGKQIKQAYEDGRIAGVPLQGGCEVNTFWDLGKSDATAIWFHQRVGAENRFIDYYEDRFLEIDDYAKVIKEKGYNYGHHYMPHDVEHQLLGFGNRTRKQMFEGAGVKPIIVVPRINSIHEGLEMVRSNFHTCWFDEKKCEKGLVALRNYKYRFDDNAKDYKPEPAHDWASHGADAFRQFAQGYRRSDGLGMMSQSNTNLRRGHQVRPSTSWMV